MTAESNGGLVLIGVVPRETDLVVMLLERGFGLEDIAVWMDGFRTGARRQREASIANPTKATHTGRLAAPVKT